MDDQIAQCGDRAGMCLDRCQWMDRVMLTGVGIL